jgi:hypothetical protein
MLVFYSEDISQFLSEDQAIFFARQSSMYVLEYL